MQQHSGFNQALPASYSVRVDNSGRIVIPSVLRDRLHFQPGNELVVRETSDGLTVSSYDQILAEAQAHFMKVATPDISMVDVLIAERRAEAAREATENDSHYE
ncbi:MAG: AbrB/MazE/SpoVT family DNA-binding domain-containing protein [Planctomycetaceae bacterium]|nr:AbrB/MazE/SpoVT family DNA-binding domain-containing protein [Planctomycetaceae bacterium]